MRDPIVRSGRLHCLRALPPPSPPRAKNLPTFPLFLPRANPHKICPSAKKSHVVTFCPKNGNLDVDFWALCAILGLPAVKEPSLAPPESYVTRGPTAAIQASKHFTNCSQGFLASESVINALVETLVGASREPERFGSVL